MFNRISNLILTFLLVALTFDNISICFTHFPPTSLSALLDFFLPLSLERRVRDNAENQRARGKERERGRKKGREKEKGRERVNLMVLTDCSLSCLCFKSILERVTKSTLKYPSISRQVSLTMVFTANERLKMSQVSIICLSFPSFPPRNVSKSES